MSGININEASKEELVSIVRQLHQRLKDNARRLAQSKEFEEQVAMLKRELGEKNAAVTALAEQNVMLSEQTARNEETIRELIKQIEELRDAEGRSASEGAAAGMRVLSPRGQQREQPSNSRTFGNGGVGGLGSAHGTGGDPASTAAATIKRQSEEIAELEHKVRELTEENMFYSKVAARRGAHEAREALRALLPDKGADSAEVEAVASLHDRIRALEDEGETLRRMLRHQEQEKVGLSKELNDLREELSQLELDLVTSERWKAEGVMNHCESPAALSLTLNDTSSTQGGDCPPSRTFAQFVSPICYKGDGSRRTLGQASRGSTGEHPTTQAGSTSNSALELDTLPVIRLSNPTKQEKMLFERLELYRKRVEQMNAYEVDRQRSFDEIERARAEMFTEMNVKLEEQRREIQRLNKQLSASEARDECVSTVLGNNERNAFMMESQRPSDTGLKMDKDIQEVVDNIELSDANVDEYMQAILRNIVEQETSNAVSKENVALPVGDVGKREAELQLIKSQCQLGGWEEKERLDNVYEGLWKFVDILLWSRRAIAQFACEADIRTVTCRKEAAAYEDKLAKIRSPVASQEQRDQELEGQLGQLQQEIKFCTVVRESKPKEEGDGFLKIQESELFEYIKTTSASRGLEDQPSLSASIEVTGGDSGGVKTLTNSKNISSVGIGFASIRSVEDGQATKEEVSPCVQRGVECLACEPGLRIGTETVGETGIKEIDSILWAGENKSSNHLHEQEGRTSTKSLEQSMKFPPPLDKSNVAQQTLQDVFQDSEWDVHLAPTIGDLKSQSKRSTQGPAPCEINQELYSAKEDQQYRETSGGKCTTNLDNLFDLTTVPQQQTPQAPVKLSGSSSFLGEFDPFA